MGSAFYTVVLNLGQDRGGGGGWADIHGISVAFGCEKAPSFE